MNKNVIIGIAVVLVLVGGIGVYKFVQLQAEPRSGATSRRSSTRSRASCVTVS